MLGFVANALVLAGAIVLMHGLIILRRLPGHLPAGSLRSRWRVMVYLVALFLLGYLGYLAAFAGTHADLQDLIVPTVFFLGAGFVWLTAKLALQTTADLLRVADLEREALTDSLTGVFNRRYLDQRLAEEVAVTRRYGRPLSVLMLDIDHFKRINDERGHRAGDAVLRQLGACVAAQLRESDVCARFGGEEFLVIAPQTDATAASDLAERLRGRIAELAITAPGHNGAEAPMRLTVSIGVAACTAETGDADALIAAADRSLYDAKAAGRNCVRTAAAQQSGAASRSGEGSA